MIFKGPTAQDKRKQLKSSLKNSCLRFVGSFSPLVSRFIQEKGFDGIYVSGAVLSSLKGWPDIGLNTLTETSHLAESLSQNSSLPSLVDIDTGFGGPVNVARSIYELEKKGLSACHIEDQSFTKRCGHLDKKKLIPVEDMLYKIQSAVKARTDKNFLIVARTDARSQEGLQGAIHRAKQYVKAGADMIFPEALQSLEEFKVFRSKISVPLVANLTEFGKTPITPYKTFKNMGYNIVIYPVSLWRLALKAVEGGLDLLIQDKQKDLLPKMQTREQLYDLLEYEKYNQFDKELFNFSLK